MAITKGKEKAKERAIPVRVLVSGLGSGVAHDVVIAGRLPVGLGWEARPPYKVLNVVQGREGGERWVITREL